MAAMSGQRKIWDAIFFGSMAAATAAYLAALWFAPSWLIGTPEYEWPALRHGLWERAPGAALVLLLPALSALIAAPRLFDRPSSIRPHLYLFLTGLVLAVGPFAVHKNGFVELPLRIYLADHTSFFTDALKVSDAGEYARSFPARFREIEAMLSEAKKGGWEDEDRKEAWSEAGRHLTTHTRTHPPGAVVLFYLGLRAARSRPGLSAAYVDAAPRSGEAMRYFGLSKAETAAGALMALLLTLAAAACLPLAYAIARYMTGDRHAVFAALLFGLAPAFSHKVPVLDHLLGLLVLAAAWLSLSGVCRKEPWRFPLAGALVGAGLWLGTAMLAALPLCLALAGAAVYHNRKSEVTMGRQAALLAMVAVLLSVPAAAVVFGIGGVLGVSFQEIYRVVSEVGWNFNNLLSGRERVSWWVGFDFYEVLAFAGVPLSFLFIRFAGRSLKAAARRQWAGIDAWLVAFLVFFLALIFSGRVVYEASRLVWFCFPFIAAMAARELALRDNLSRTALVIFLQVISVLMFRMVF